MATKKTTKTTKSSDKTELEQRVDAIMDPNESATPPKISKAETAIDIFKDIPEPTLETKTKTTPKTTKTAPAVPSELLKDIPGDETAQPAKIKVSTKKTTQPADATAEEAAPSSLPATEPEPTPESKPDTEPESETTAEASTSKLPDSDVDLDDSATDAAVDDIVVSESDTVLAVEDALTRRRNGAVEDAPHHYSTFAKLVFWLVVAMSAAVAYLWFR